MTDITKTLAAYLDMMPMPTSTTSSSAALPDVAFEPGERVIVLLGTTRTHGTLIDTAGSKARVKLDRMAVLEVSTSWLEREETR